MGLAGRPAGRLIYLIKHVRPAFEGDALEDGEHGEAKVVKVGDAVVGSLPARQADHVDGGAVESHLARVGTRVGVFHHITCPPPPPPPHRKREKIRGSSLLHFSIPPDEEEETDR